MLISQTSDKIIDSYKELPAADGLGIKSPTTLTSLLPQAVGNYAFKRLNMYCL
jgi:hypothetical protein